MGGVGASRPCARVKRNCRSGQPESVPQTDCILGDPGQIVVKRSPFSPFLAQFARVVREIIVFSVFNLSPEFIP